MGSIGPVIFSVFMLIFGFLATTNPSRIIHIYEKLGEQSPLDETTTRRSIRSAGVIGLLMAAVIFWEILHGGIVNIPTKMTGDNPVRFTEANAPASYFYC